MNKKIFFVTMVVADDFEKQINGILVNDGLDLKLRILEKVLVN